MTSALDPISAEQVEETLEDLKAEYTIIMVTHSMDQAKRLADEVVFLYLGELIEANDTRSFFENPENDRTREFVKGHTAVEYTDSNEGDDTDTDSGTETIPAE